MNIIKAVAVAAVAASFSACSHAGPFVKEISADGNGGISITKCEVTTDAVFGILRDGACTQAHVQVVNPK